MKKYLVIGGYVISQSDKEKHYVSAHRLCELYGIKQEDCDLVNEFKKGYSTSYRDLAKYDKILRPKNDGSYELD